MNKITFPLELLMRGPEVGDLQAALRLLLDRGIILRCGRYIFILWNSIYYKGSVVL